MDDLPILDRARLDLISRGDLALADEFLRALIDEATVTIERLRSALSASQPTAVADLAHSLKGMATEVGALRLRVAAAALEAEAKPERWAGLLGDAITALADLRSLANEP